MRQAHLTAPRTIEWRDTPTPIPRPGEMLVRIRAALTCGTDLKMYRRGHPKLLYGPFGHEASGDVVAVGRGVEAFKPGDAVMWVQTAPCGECRECVAGHENHCERLFDEIALGAFGDLLVLPARVATQNVYMKPPKLSYIEAAFLEPLSCVVHGWNALEGAGGRMPENVVIIGAGTIGLLHLFYAARAGIRVTTIARGAPRRALAEEMGAAVVDAADGEAIAKVFGTFDASIECAGTLETWGLAPKLVAPGGRVLFFSGLPSGTEVPIDATRLHYGELTLLGTFHFTPSDVRAAAKLLGAPGANLRPLISGIEHLEKLPEIFERLDRREGHKYALVPDGQRAEWI